MTATVIQKCNFSPSYVLILTVWSPPLRACMCASKVQWELLRINELLRRKRKGISECTKRRKANAGKWQIESWKRTVPEKYPSCKRSHPSYSTVTFKKTDNQLCKAEKCEKLLFGKKTENQNRALRKSQVWNKQKGGGKSSKNDLYEYLFL